MKFKMSSNAYVRMGASNNQGGSTGYSYGVNSHHNAGHHGSHQNNNNNDASQSTVSPEDYLGKQPPDLTTLEKQNVNVLLRDAVSLLLENRPANPILFMAEHFKNIQQS